MTANTTPKRGRRPSYIIVILTALCYINRPLARASSSVSDNSRYAIQRFANQDGPPHTTRTNNAPRIEVNTSSVRKSQAFDSSLDTVSRSDHVDETNAADLPRHKKSSVSINPAGIVSLLQNVILNSSKPLLKAATFTAQIAIAAYITKMSWNVIKEAWDEINEEYASIRKNDDVREEQDMPFVDSKDVSELDDVDDQSATNNNIGTSRGKGTHQITAMKDLASRLRSAGIPFASEIEYDQDNTSAPRSVESVIKSLTRSEGNVLSQTLLTPVDDAPFQGNNQDLESVATNTWNAIGGLAQAKESLLDLAFPLLPSSSSESNNYYGGLLANPPGVLLYGPPGCGKSMLVRALANTVGARFLVVSPSCLLRKYVGETNLNVRALFTVAAKISPCVIFVDELDGLFRERGGEDHDVSRDLKTEFLQLWDGIRHNHLQGGGMGASSSSVLVIGATNRPFDVDPAFLRRMPRRIFIGLPDYNARVAVLSNMLNSVPLEESFDIDLVARQTQGYSPSDLREVLQAAALHPLREARAAAISSRAGNESNQFPLSIPPLRKLQTDDVLKALQIAKPTHFSKRYERDLMEYVRRSGGSRSDAPASEHNNSPSSVSDGITFSSEFWNNEEQEDSEQYSYDESDSDDDL